jgi:hypothetical protein
MKKHDHEKSFWLSYSDLLTSLFFVSLILFIAVWAYSKLLANKATGLEAELAEAEESLDTRKGEFARLQAQLIRCQTENADLDSVRANVQMRLEKFQIIQAIDSATRKVNTRYFVYNQKNKRFRLRVDPNFRPNSHNIRDIPSNIRLQIKEAGKELNQFLEVLQREFPEVEFLVVIEGNTQKYNENWKRIPNDGYRLSYNRALALLNYWKNNQIDLGSNANCEVLLVGSGYFGRGREVNEEENRKFTIQITPKVGEFFALEN